MEEKAIQISDRLLDYGGKIIKICIKLNKTAISKHIGNQLLRAGTSVEANYEEACGAQSRADFIHKLQIVLKEIKESMIQNIDKYAFGVGKWLTKKQFF